MSSYILAFFWGFFILLSLIGWGSLINYILFPKHKVDWGLLATWGLAISIFIGGLLNLAWSISRITIFIYLGLGILSFFLNALNRNSLLNSVSKYIKYSRKDSLFLIGTLLICFFILLQYAGWVSTNSFHVYDDLSAYFVFPNKMLQSGSLGADPFSGRKLLTSLGGQYFLHTIVLCVFSEENLRLLDPGLALIIFIGLILGFLKEKSFFGKTAVWLVFPFLLIIPPGTNTTSLITGSVLFLGLFRTLHWEKLKEYNLSANAFIIALITAAVIGLKTIFLPVAGLLFCLSYFFYIIKSSSRRKAIYEFIVATLLTILFLIPWMISMYLSSGTLLFPLLGKGYYASVYYDHYTEKFGEIKWFIHALIRIQHIAFFLLCFAYLLLQPWKKLRNDKRGSVLSLIISSLLGTIIVIFGTSGHHPRYTFPFIYPAIVVLIIILFAQINIRDRNRRKFLNFPVMVAILVISMLIGNGGWKAVRDYNLKLVNNIKYGLENRFSVSGQREISQYNNMQQSVPPGAILLTRLKKPFLLNFSRNPILIVDLPGYASPPPGMPIFEGSETLSDYLTTHSIRYVAFDYVKEPGPQRTYWRKRLGSEIYPWVKPKRILEIRPLLRREVQYAVDFHDNLQKLGQSRKKVYDDGKIFVIDLLSRVNGLAQSEETSFSTSKVKQTLSIKGRSHFYLGE